MSLREKGWFWEKPVVCGGCVGRQRLRPRGRSLARSVRLGRRELGDGLGALGDGVLGELAGKHEADRGLDLPGRERRLLGEAAELGRLERDALEDVVDEGVHDRHALLGDTRVGVDLCAEA